MYEPTICEPTVSATSSPVSEAGATPCDSLGFPTTDLFGLALAPASHSARPARSVAATMSATYGLRSSASSASVALESSLASRLPEVVATHGGIMWRQTWKAKATPQRRRILAHTRSGLLTSDSDCTGWPTPNAGPQNDNDSTWQARRDRMKIKHGNGNGFGLNLGQAATLAAWPTPTSSDPQGAATPEAVKKWASRGHNLPEQAQMAAWATPKARDHKGDGVSVSRRRPDSIGDSLDYQATHGLMPNGSTAQTEKPGQLNAAFSRWLMGYPKAWCEAAIAAHRSMPTRRAKRG